MGRVGPTLAKVGERAIWHHVAEDGYNRWVADYLGFMIEVWNYLSGPDTAEFYWRVSHRSLLTSIVGVEGDERYAKGMAVQAAMQQLGALD